jgi:tRNA pseudouridine38-40 synthase
MTRYRLTIEYNGSQFSGWQRQENAPSVQEALEEAICDLSTERVAVTGAGRTDAGVHALGQCAHFDLEKEISPDTVQNALNAHLRPHLIVIVQAESVPEDFHARFSALARHYEYRIFCRRAPPALDHGFVWHVARKLDAETMHDAAQILLGKHDFTTFRSVQCQAKTPVKTLDCLNVSRRENEIIIYARARSFLHNQVRSLVGSLKLVGEGKWTSRDLQRALEACDRSTCGPVAPPQGLTLLQVDYPAF